MINKNLINIKNLLKIVISCFVIISMLKSCSMAYNIEDIYQYALQIQTLENVPTRVKAGANRIINNYDKIKNLSQLLDCKSIVVDAGPYSTSYTNIHYWNTSYKITTDNSQNIRGMPSTYFIRITDQDVVSPQNWNIDWSNDRTTQFGLLDLSANTEEEIDLFNWNGWYLNNKYEEPSTFQYTPYNITTIDDYNILKFTYVGNVALGQLGENNFYQLQVRLKDSSLITLGTALFNENQECYYRDNALIVEDNQTILANTVYLSYYEPYYLEFTIYSDSTNYEINGYLYKFYPPNAVIENGQIVSPGSGDYSNQAQTIDIIGGVVGDLPSGDSPGSGILGGIARLFIPDKDFFLNYFNNLNTWLTEHLGFIYSPFEIFINIFNRILTIDYSNPHVEIGPYNLPLNDNFELIPKLTYNFNDLLEVQEFKDIHDIYLVIVDGLIFIGFISLCYHKYEEIIGGKDE